MTTTSDMSIIAFPSEETSFTRAFLEFVSNYEAKLAFIDPETKENLAFWDLEIIVDQIRHHLHQHGLTKGNVVATLCGNSIEYLLMCLAAIDLGAIIVPINPASTKFEIEKYLLVCKVDHVVIERKYQEKIAIALKRQEKFEKIPVIILDRLRGLEEGELPPHKNVEVPLCGEETAFIFFSSGTTGPPKAVKHSHRTLLAPLCQVMTTAISESKYPFPCLLGDNRVHGVLPYFHAGGLITVFCMLVEGVTVVINRKFTEATFLRILTEYKISIINIVPSVLDFLVKHPAVDCYDLSALKLVFVGASKCEESQIRALKERLPDLEDVVQSLVQKRYVAEALPTWKRREFSVYGMTEAGMLLFATPKGNTRLSSVGRPFPGVDAAIVNENKETLKNNEEGELVVRSPSMMEGYLGCATNFIIYPDSWLQTGDLARIDDEGFVYIVGRVKEMIKVRGWQPLTNFRPTTSHGPVRNACSHASFISACRHVISARIIRTWPLFYKVNPYEIEEAIKANLPDVKDCAVVGVEHGRDGHLPKAFVVGDVDKDDIINFVKEHFISYKHLCGVERVDKIPRTESGKIKRVLLSGELNPLL